MLTFITKDTLNIMEQPLNKLLQRIKHDNVDGKEVIEGLYWLKKETGWNETELYQIE